MKFLTYTSIPPITSHWLDKWSRAIGLGHVLFTFLFILWYWNRLPAAIPFWYSKPWGQDRLAQPFFLFLLPISSMILFALNTMLAYQLRVRHPIYARVLLLNTMLISLISTGVVVGIIRLVT